MTDPQTVKVVVALVTNDQGQVLITWNPKWGGFTFPMTKRKQPDDAPPETAEHAALRAAAEATGRPVRLKAKAAGTTRGLLLGARDATVKNYVYTVVPVGVHPDFAAHVGTGPAFWAAPKDLDAGGYEPLTDTVEPLLAVLREWGWVGG